MVSDMKLDLKLLVFEKIEISCGVGCYMEGAGGKNRTHTDPAEFARILGSAHSQKAAWTPREPPGSAKAKGGRAGHWRGPGQGPGFGALGPGGQGLVDS